MKEQEYYRKLKNTLLFLLLKSIYENDFDVLISTNLVKDIVFLEGDIMSILVLDKAIYLIDLRSLFLDSEKPFMNELHYPVNYNNWWRILLLFTNKCGFDKSRFAILDYIGKSVFVLLEFEIPIEIYGKFTKYQLESNFILEYLPSGYQDESLYVEIEKSYSLEEVENTLKALFYHSMSLKNWNMFKCVVLKVFLNIFLALIL